MRLVIALLLVLGAPGLAAAWVGSGLGPVTPPPPHDYSTRELRASAIAADALAPWCAFMHFGPDGPSEARLRVEPGATMPDGVSIEVDGGTDAAMLARFTDCLRPLIAGLAGTYTGRRALRRTFALHHDGPRRSVRTAADALVAAHRDAIRACAPGGASIAAIRLDVYRGEVRLDSVYLPSLDPRYAMAGTGDGSVHDCVSAIVTGTTIDARGRVYPVVDLD